MGSRGELSVRGRGWGRGVDRSGRVQSTEKVEERAAGASEQMLEQFRWAVQEACSGSPEVEEPMGAPSQAGREAAMRAHLELRGEGPADRPQK